MAAAPSPDGDAGRGDRVDDAVGAAGRVGELLPLGGAGGGGDAVADAGRDGDADGGGGGGGGGDGGAGGGGDRGGATTSGAPPLEPAGTEPLPSPSPSPSLRSEWLKLPPLGGAPVSCTKRRYVESSMIVYPTMHTTSAHAAMRNGRTMAPDAPRRGAAGVGRKDREGLVWRTQGVTGYSNGAAGCMG